GFQETAGLVEQWPKGSQDRVLPALFSEGLPPGRAGLRVVQALQRLVREGVGIMNLSDILAIVADTPPEVEVDDVVERARKAEALKGILPGNEGRRRRIALAEEWEKQFEHWVDQRDGKSVLAIPIAEEPLLNAFVDGM